MNLIPSLALLTLLQALLVPSSTLETIKCCDDSETLTNHNGTFSCARDESRRYQISTNITGFVSTGLSGQCVEGIIEGFFVFNVTEDGEILRAKPVREPSFPKCCPLGSVYDTSRHSCKEKSTTNRTYGTFVTVGLAHCNVIQDFNLNGTTDFIYNLLETSTGLDRNRLDYIGSYCLDENQEGSLTLRECKDSIRVCEEEKCIKKCCPDGQSFVNGPICEDTYKHGVDLEEFGDAIENPTEPYVVLYNRSCPLIYVFKREEYNYSINDRGIFTYWAKGKKLEEDISNMESYCIEHTRTRTYDQHLLFMCFGTPKSEDKYLYTFYPLIVSCVFLLLTIVAYFMLSETKKMFGKILVNYCLAMLLEFAVLANSYKGDSPSITVCQLRAFAIIFFATASFTWSNILCWDIWCTFGSTKLMGMRQWKVDLKQLLLYSMYGWGVPLVLTVFIFIFYKFNQVLPKVIQPLLANERCFFDSEPHNYGKMVFFDFPLLIMQLFNTILFVKTALYCIKVKNEINKINDTTKNMRTRTFQKDKERLFLILKLLTIMGISFLFEVVSGFFEMGEMGDVPKYIEITWDFINALQGFFIFVVFVCKRKIFNGFVNRMRNPLLSRLSTSSIHTHSSNMVNGMVLNPLVAKN